MAWYAEKNRGPGDEDPDGNFDPAEDPDEGFDEEPDTTDLTPPHVGRGAVSLVGPGDEDDEGFDEEPDWSERDDDTERETR